MKRYMLFCGTDYYPLGGMRDFCGRFSTRPEVRRAAAAWGKRESSSFMWGHVYDTQAERICVEIDFDDDNNLVWKEVK